MLGARAVKDIVQSLSPDPETSFGEIEIDKRFPGYATEIASNISINIQEHHWQTIAALKGTSERRDLAMRIAKEHWNGKSDAVLYEDGNPLGIIEIKKFDEGGDPQKILCDKLKTRFITSFTGIVSFIGLYLTDVSGKPCGMRLLRLNEVLGHTPLTSAGPFPSRDGRWEWCFPVWAFEPDDYDLTDDASKDIIAKATPSLRLLQSGRSAGSSVNSRS